VLALIGQALATLLLATANATARDALPDPTEPPPGIGPLILNAVADPQETLDLKAIFFARDRRVAIINDQRVQEGGSIGAARILEIAPNRVRLLREGEEIMLELVESGIKRDSGSDAAATPASAPPAAPAPAARAKAPDDSAEAGR
jgi:MSHA biogenesis protein MshK